MLAEDTRLDAVLSDGFAARFWAKVKKSDGCWLWTACKKSDGYGRIAYPGRSKGAISAHRASWIMHNGPITAGLVVCHRCDVPACVNPSHLFLGTQDENMKDCAAKQRIRAPVLRGSDARSAKLTEAQVVEIRKKLAAGARLRQLAAEYGVTRGNIFYIEHRLTWRHLA